jgi:hypothetical protein
MTHSQATALLILIQVLIMGYSTLIITTIAQTVELIVIVDMTLGAMEAVTAVVMVAAAVAINYFHVKNKPFLKYKPTQSFYYKKAEALCGLIIYTDGTSILTIFNDLNIRGDHQPLYKMNCFSKLNSDSKT